MAERGYTNPDSTALIVVDVQNDFCHPEGALAKGGNDVSMVKSMMLHLRRLIEGAHRCDVPVIYIQTIHEPATDSQIWTERMGGRSNTVCRKGSWGADFYEISPGPEDIVVNKHRYSAFINTRLESVLRTLKVDTLVMSGVSTNVCVESTARDGYMLDYRILFAYDACAAYSLRAHEMTLENIDRFFGTVVDTDHVVRTWDTAKAKAQAPAGT